MRQTRAFSGVLHVLDEGLRIYRRNLSGFLLVASTVLVALAVLAMSFMAFVRSEIGTTSGWTAIAVLLVLLMGYPLVLYAFGALSRAASAAIDDQPIALGAVLRLSPIRGCGMILFNMLFSVMASIIATILAAVISCPISYVSLVTGLAISGISSGIGEFGLVITVTVTFISWFWSLSIFSGWMTSLVFAVQAFVLERQPWSRAVSRTLDLLAHRFGQSLLMFLGAGAIFSTLILSYLGSLLALLGILQDRLGLRLPPIATDAIIIVLVIGSLVLLLPPLAIWMTMFFRQLALGRDGNDLSQHIAAWRAQPGAAKP